MNLAVSNSGVIGRATDAAFRVARWRRQQRLIAGDPLVLDPRVDPLAERLA
jgi:hypothetical protein